MANTGVDGTGKRSRRMTRIVCTIGPASSSPLMIERLVRAGMDCARLNFSHGTPEEHLEALRNVRSASRLTGRHVAVMQDLPGPKLRVGTLEKGSMRLEEGSIVTLVTSPSSSRHSTERDGSSIPVESKGLPGYVKIGSVVFLSDGTIALRVISTSETTIRCKCEVGGVLVSGKGVNIPDLKEQFETFTDLDRRYLAFGLEHGVDLVAVSFVRSARDLKSVREFMNRRSRTTKRGTHDDDDDAEGVDEGAQVKSSLLPLLVAKVEKKEAYENIAEIVETSDAVMVARGDLGVENPIEDLPQMQKTIISKCRLRGVPVVTATQMLESMVSNPSPTRAEATDVANAILDGTDAVMLSEETAVGAYPLECVDIITRIALKTEERMFTPEGRAGLSLRDVRSQGLRDAFSQSAWQLAEDIGAAVIAVRSGDEAVIPKISRFRSAASILHMSAREAILRRSSLNWGVFQCKTALSQESETGVDSSVQTLVRAGFLREDDRAVLVRDEQSSGVHARFSLSAVVVGRSAERGSAGVIPARERPR